MASIQKIEDFEVWKKSRLLVKHVFSTTSHAKFDKENFLKDQLKRSAISVMSNIAEGYGRGGNKEFVQFLYNANGSLNELKSQLYIATDVDLINSEQLNEILEMTFPIELMIKSLSRKLKESQFKGAKFKTVS